MRPLLSIARVLCDADDVERIVAPAIADAEHERDLARARGDRAAERRVATHARFTLPALVLRVAARAYARRTAHTPAAPLALAAATAALSTFALSHAAPSAMRSQLLFGAIAVALAALLTSLPRSWLYRMAWPMALFGVALTAWAAHSGDPIGEARRWLSVGALRIHVGVFLPLWVVLATAAALPTPDSAKLPIAAPQSRRRPLAALALVALSLTVLALARDPVPMSQISVAALVVSLSGARHPLASTRARIRVSLALCGVAGLVASWVVRPTLPVVATVETPFSVMFDRHPLLPLAAGALLLAMIVSVLRLARRSPHAEALAIGAGLGLEPVFASLARDPIDIVGLGGSGLVAAFLSVSVVCALAARPNESAPDSGTWNPESN
ncbi:MAG: hypothetical protein U0271_18705 [Polyangiaceae bacterium]